MSESDPVAVLAVVGCATGAVVLPSGPTVSAAEPTPRPDVERVVVAPEGDDVAAVRTPMAATVATAVRAAVATTIARRWRGASVSLMRFRASGSGSASQA